MKNSALLIGCLLLVVHCTDSSTNQRFAPQKAPDFRLEDIRHKRFYLNQQEGKPIVIVFWATWCKACKQYLTALETMTTTWEGKPFTLVSIVVDPENRDTLQALLNNVINISYPVLLDRQKKVMKQFNVKEFPTTFILGQNKSVVMEKKGYTLSTMTQIRNKLNLLLAEDT